MDNNFLPNRQGEQSETPSIIAGLLWGGCIKWWYNDSGSITWYEIYNMKYNYYIHDNSLVIESHFYLNLLNGTENLVTEFQSFYELSMKFEVVHILVWMKLVAFV